MTDTAINEFKAHFQRLLELREQRDIDKKTAKKSERLYRDAEAELFQELEEAGVKGRQTFDFGGDLGTAKFQARSTNYGRIIDREVALAALEAEGLDEVIYERSIRDKRLNELVRDRLESGSELPDGVDFYSRQGISISRK